VLQCFFEALSTAEIDLSARTLREADLRREELLKAQSQQVERLRHVAHLADRQFRRSDPDNRLVTAELERRWEAALRDLQQAEDVLQTSRQKVQIWAIPADLLQVLKNICPRLPELWSQPLLSWSQKKGLLRSLVEKVVLKRNHDEVALRVVWHGGDVTEMTIPITVGRFEQLRDHHQIETTILTLAKDGRSDNEIARHLTNAGHRSPRHIRFLRSTVTRIRLKHNLKHNLKQSPIPARTKVIAGYLRPYQLAARLQIQPHWIYDRIRNGTIKIKKHAQHNAFLFPDVPKTLEKLRQLLNGHVKTISF